MADPLAFTLPVAIAVVSAFLVKPIYSAESEVLVRPGHEYTPPSDTDPGTAQPPQVTMQEMIDNEIAILTSSNLLRLIVQQVGATKLYPDLTKVASAPPPAIISRRARPSAWPRGLACEPGQALGRDQRVAPQPRPRTRRERAERILAAFQEMHLEAFSRDHRSSVLAQQVGSDIRSCESWTRSAPPT